MQEKKEISHPNGMNRFNKHSTFLIATIAWLLLLLPLESPLQADCWAKIDLAPAVVRIDILESEKTVKRMDMMACRADGAFTIAKGFCIKPSVLVGSGGGTVFNGAVGIGYYTPIQPWLALTPTIGCSYGNLRTHIDVPFLGRSHVKERFRSISPYLGLEATVKFAEGWRFSAVFQYAWSRTHTTLKNILSVKGHSAGPNYGLVLERDLNNQWSINVGAAYNISLSKEKHGIRGMGAKLGLVRWF